MSVHALREVEVPNAITGAPKPEVLAGATTTPELMQRLKDGIALAKAQGGPQGFTKASVPVLDILVTTSRDDPARMGKAGQDSYFRKALDFLAEKFGGMANILTAVIHRDETTPHLSVLLMPLDRTTHRFSAAKMIRGPKGLSELQDEFHLQVGKQHGLLRGEKGSTAQHVPVRQLYAAMNAGESPPKLVPVPNAPGMVDRLKPGYADKKRAHEVAIALNKKTYARLEKQAKTGRMLHPKMIERQAERYRAAVHLEASTKDNLVKAAAIRKASAEDRKVAHELATIARKAESDMIELAQTADRRWEKGGASVLDKWTRTMAPEMVARVAKQLGIELVAGRPLLDQMRRQGRGSTLIECADRLDRAIDGTLHGHVYSGQAQRDIDRPKPRG